MSKDIWSDGFFKIDPECHIIGDMEPVNHFPGVQMWWKAIDSIMRPKSPQTPRIFCGRWTNTAWTWRVCSPKQ